MENHNTQLEDKSSLKTITIAWDKKDKHDRETTIKEAPTGELDQDLYKSVVPL